MYGKVSRKDTSAESNAKLNSDTHFLLSRSTVCSVFLTLLYFGQIIDENMIMNWSSGPWCTEYFKSVEKLQITLFKNEFGLWAWVVTKYCQLWIVLRLYYKTMKQYSKLFTKKEEDDHLISIMGSISTPVKFVSSLQVFRVLQYCRICPISFSTRKEYSHLKSVATLPCKI